MVLQQLSRRADFRRCRELLPAVSRTFTLSIRVLPAPLRDSVTVSYLICRMADALEDATGCDPIVRVDALQSLAHLAAAPSVSPERMAERFPGAAFSAGDLGVHDAALLRERLTVFRAYDGLPGEDRRAAGRWISTLARGMSSTVELELQTASGLPAGGPSFDPRARAVVDPGPAGRTSVPNVLQTMEELRRYCWYVAGTVGLLLTGLFRLYLDRSEAARAHPRPWMSGPEVDHLAVSFGRGLQLTNILQDLAEDRRRGWSYLPEELARRHGTTVARLDHPGEQQAALRAIGELVLEAAASLDGALEYILLLPAERPRLRLFCLWPVFFALRTLTRLCGEERILTGAVRVRITRREVHGLMAETVSRCRSDAALRRLYLRERRRLERKIARRPV
jgi:farnesyl-diphosphate farnesyltransferase